MNRAKQLHWAAWAGAAGLAAVAVAGWALYNNARRTLIAGPQGRLAVDDNNFGDSTDHLPVLFVHSFAGSSAHWHTQLPHLRSTRRGVAMDLRGNGQSDAPRNNDYSIEGMADDIAAVADALGLQRFVLVGHSMGGMASAAYAGKHPERVAGLMLVTTPGKSPAEMSEKIMASLNADFDHVMAGYWATLTKGARPSIHAKLEAAMRKVPRDAATAMTGALFDFDPLPALGAYTGPIHIIDSQQSEEGPTALHRQAPHIPRDLMTGTSHWPQLDEPERFNGLLDRFLEKVG